MKNILKYIFLCFFVENGNALFGQEVNGNNTSNTANNCTCTIKVESEKKKARLLKKQEKQKNKIEKIPGVKKKETIAYKVQKLIEEGDFHVEIDESYDLALEIYLEAHQLDSLNPQIHFRVGKCYIYSQHADINKAIAFLENAHKLDHEVHTEIRYYLGLAYHINGVWIKAIKNYNIYLASIPVNDKVKKEKVQKKISECHTADLLSKKPDRTFVTRMEPGINTEFSEFCPVLSPDGNTLYFTSRREDAHRGITLSHFHHYEDIYFSEKINGSWSTPQTLGYPFNTKGHDATACISPDGYKMIIYRNGDLYESDFDDEFWSKPRKLSDNINSRETETSACFSPDGKTLYFVSDRLENSFGGLDIFKSELQKDGSWGKAENLGKNINTKHNEEGIFIHPKGNILYFSSEGHHSIGGYDVFKSPLLKDNTWGKVESMGLPINSAGDDVFFILDKSGKQGFYTSSRKGGLGNKDIYSITLIGRHKEPVINTDNHSIASSKEKDSETTFNKETENQLDQLLYGLLRGNSSNIQKKDKDN